MIDKVFLKKIMDIREKRVRIIHYADHDGLDRAIKNAQNIKGELINKLKLNGRIFQKISNES